MVVIDQKCLTTTVLTSFTCGLGLSGGVKTTYWETLTLTGVENTLLFWIKMAKWSTVHFMEVTHS